MAYIICEPCVGTKDTACVDVCPVDCIHPRKDEPEFQSKDMLYIHPDECIDCGACVPACPVEAIFALDETPEKWVHFIPMSAVLSSKAMAASPRSCELAGPTFQLVGPMDVAPVTGRAQAAVIAFALSSEARWHEGGGHRCRPPAPTRHAALRKPDTRSPSGSRGRGLTTWLSPFAPVRQRPPSLSGRVRQSQTRGRGAQEARSIRSRSDRAPAMRSGRPDSSAKPIAVRWARAVACVCARAVRRRASSPPRANSIRLRPGARRVGRSRATCDIHALIMTSTNDCTGSAGVSYRNYINLLPNKDRSEKAAWARRAVGSSTRSAMRRR